MPKAKKQPAKKRGRPVKKKVSPKNHDLSISEIDSAGGWEPVPVNNKPDTEIESLATICSIMDNFDPDQKTRNIRFLASRYWDYLKD